MASASLARTRPVLVVDDDPDIREALVDVLGDAGFAASSAGDGLEALDVLRRGPHPGIILLDLMMPRMDGFRFRHEQLRDPEIAGIPVVALTASRGMEDRCRDLGIDRCLPKPFDAGDLVELLVKYF